MNEKNEVKNFEINGYPIHYEKFGSGSEVVLLIPGAIGIARHDFKQQLEGNNALNLKRYTFIGVELPGYGRSRPPKRKYGPDMYKFDADCSFKLMQNLGYNSFSIIGWSDGAKVALIMCHLNPNRVKCLVAISVLAQENRETLQAFQLTRDITIWPKEQLEAYLGVYGDSDSLQLIWNEKLDADMDAMDMKFATEENPEQFILKPEELKCIRTPVILVHGDGDPWVGLYQAQFYSRHIRGAELHRFVEGAHICHQEFAAKFKEIVEDFFDSCGVCLPTIS